jgi:hypothetical protein
VSAGRSIAAWAGPWTLLLAACATSAYQPLPLSFPGGLPPDAAARVEACMRRLYGPLSVAEADGLRYRTAWVPHRRGDLPGELRATVFAENDRTLAIVVEVRFLVLSMTGVPYWTQERADPYLEAELADALQKVLR